MALSITPLGKSLGAEVTGLNLSRPLSAADKNALTTAFLSHHLVCVRSEVLAPDDFVRFGANFGKLQPQLYRNRFHPDEPLVSIMRSALTSKQLARPDRIRVAGWHTDDSYFPEPCKATLLQAIELPATGGATRFCNLKAAYEALDSTFQAHLTNLHAVHCYDTNRAHARAKDRTNKETQETKNPAVHPIVRTHPDTGKKNLYLNFNRMDRILELDQNESNAILDSLFAHIDQQRFHYHHIWQRGDILMWDNRCTMHAAVPDYEPGVMRLHHRILLRGEVPV